MRHPALKESDGRESLKGLRLASCSQGEARRCKERAGKRKSEKKIVKENCQPFVGFEEGFRGGVFSC